jgi:hypothetical protein
MRERYAARWQSGVCPQHKQTAPLAEAPPLSHVNPGYQACTFTAGQVTQRELRSWPLRLAGCSYLGRLPRLVARGYTGCRVRTIWPVSHFYDGSAGLGRPQRNQFVIFIDPGVHMSRGRLTNASTGQPRSRATRRSARSGLTACGWPTVSSIGRSVAESL